MSESNAQNDSQEQQKPEQTVNQTIEGLLASVKADVDYIRKMRPEIEEAAKVIQTARGSLDANVDAISKTVSRFEALHQDAQKKSEEMGTQQTELSNKLRVQTHKLIQQATIAAIKMADRNVWAWRS